MDASWYVVITKPRQEGTAVLNLQRQGYRTYYPRVRTRKKRGKKLITAIEPMFPRYLFVQLVAEQDNFSPIRSTIGVLAMVRFGTRYGIVDDDFIEMLHARTGEGGICDLQIGVPQRGDQVVVVDGPLSGYEGIFTAEHGEERVAILMKIAGRSVEVKLARELVERIA